MKKIILILICFFSFGVYKAQTNEEIASVYIKRSTESLNNLEVKLAKTHFDKAIKYLDSVITNVNVAKLGMKIHFELDYFKEAKKFSNKYFSLVQDKNTEEYLELLDLSVDINEALEAELREEKRKEQERIKKEKELKRIDSLKTVWRNKSADLSIKADSILSFNKNNTAIYIKDDKVGILDDRGKIIMEASEYKNAISAEGFILLMNDKKQPTKIYSYNTTTKTGFVLPSVNEFNLLSTHFGKVMLPRENGRLVTYPNNSYEPMVYDLNLKKTVRLVNKTELFKSLKKNDIIDKYNKEGEIKINKKWYTFGGHLGGGIHPLYFEKNYEVNSFLCSVDGKMLELSSGYKYLGAFHNNKIQAIKDDVSIWINQNGTKVSRAEDRFKNYRGNSKIVKLNEKSYQIMIDGIIVLDAEELEKMSDFLRKFSKQE